MEGCLKKEEFKEKRGYSESTYQRRMKIFKSSEFRRGYVAPTKNEVYINTNLYDQFLLKESNKRFEYQEIGGTNNEN